MIPEVDVIAIEVEDNVLAAHVVTGLATSVIDAIGYMVDFLVMLIWLNLLMIH